MSEAAGPDLAGPTDHLHRHGQPLLPGVLAITPDGRTFYAAGGAGAPYNYILYVLPIRTAASTAGRPIRPAGSFFAVMQVTWDGKTLWALAANGFLDRIDVATGRPVRTIGIRGGLESMALVPGGRKVFVGQDQAWGHVVPVNTVTGIRSPDVPGAREITAMALEPECGRTLWAVGNTTGTAVPTNTATDHPERVGDSPQSPSWSCDTPDVTGGRAGHGPSTPRAWFWPTALTGK